MGQVAEWVGRSGVGCRAGRSAQPTERLGLKGGDEILRSADPSGALKARYAQDDKLGERLRCGQRVFVGRELKLEIGLERRKKQVPRSANSPGGQSPRCARNDNSRGFRRDVSPVEAGSGAWMTSHRSEDRPLHAERIRRPWEARACAAMGKVVGPGLEVGRAGGFGLVVGRRAEVEAARRGEKPHP